MRRPIKRPRQSQERAEGGGFDPALDHADIGPMEITAVSQFFLGDAERLPVPAHDLAKAFLKEPHF